MIAPVWMALPPEVHSSLLGSGPGSGPLLAVAAAWSSMSAEYAAVADELGALLGAVRKAWEGPGAERYVAAHIPYLNWLLDSAATGTVAAALHQAAADAYSAALTAMPTPAELAANHATRAALLATNFFGINAIPLAINEADYARMWLQAAETMMTYQAVAESALAAVPKVASAPKIVAPGAEASIAGTASAGRAAQSWQDQLAAVLKRYTSEFAWPVSKDLNPGGWPIPAVPFANGLTSALMQIPGMSPALAAALAWATFHTLMIFWPFGQQAIQLTVSVIPALAAAYAAGAVGVTAAGAAAAGVALPVSLPLATGAPAPSGAVPAPAPAGGVPAGAGGGAAASSPAPADAVTTTGVGPAGGGPGTGLGPTAFDGVDPAPSDVLYAVGLSGSPARTGTGRRPIASRESAPDDADDSAPDEAVACERTRERRRRGATARGHAHRHELMQPNGFGPQGDTSASENGAGPLGFAGTAAESAAAPAAGLMTLTGDGSRDGPAVPMLPTGWA